MSSGEERGLISRTAAGNRAYDKSRFICTQSKTSGRSLVFPRGSYRGRGEGGGGEGDRGLWHGSRTEKIEENGSQIQKFRFPESRK